MRALRRRFVDMEELRVEALRERLDLVGGEGVAADRESIADLDFLEIFHGRGSGWRRPSIEVVIIVVRQLPASSSTSNRNFVNPISGRLLEGRLSSTVARMRIFVPGRSGLSQRTSSMPGEPIELESRT